MDPSGSIEYQRGDDPHDEHRNTGDDSKIH
jgi:hypothetical protein